MGATPILDREQPAPAPPPRRRGLPIAIGAAIGVALVLIPFGMPDSGPMTPILLLAALFPALLAGILLHELGHVAAGLLVGFEFRRLLVGPWMFTKESTGYRLRFVSGRVLAGGYTMMSPASPEDLRRRFALFAAGGPIATLLVFIPIALLPWGLPALMLLLLNTLMACGSWLPYEMRGHYTDAKIISVLWRRGPEAERLAAVLYLMALDARGVRPCDWPAEVLSKLSVPGGGRAYRAIGRIFLHVYARDTGAPAEVAAALEQVLELSAELRGDLRRMYFAEAAFWQAKTNRNAAVAHAWLDDARAVKDAITQKDWDAAALAGIALAEGDEAQFRGHLGRALAYLDRQPGPSGSVASSRARLEALAVRQETAS